jgi:hypothetical protein
MNVTELTTAITNLIVRLASSLSRLSASLQPPDGADGLDRRDVDPGEGIYVMAAKP